MSGGARQARNRRILAASDICHICGHPGADAIDHVVPLARGGFDGHPNLAPAHHDVPCPTCDHRCNREKSDKLVAPIIRRSDSLRRPRGSLPSPTGPEDCGG
jgi:5-methylcytosine-specific restriction endonuclease McrA